MGITKILISSVVLLFFTTTAYSDFVYREDSGDNGWRTRVDQTNGLKIFWWNLGCHNSKKVRQNLKNLMLQEDSVRPDILILGEYCGEKLKEKKMGLLDALLDVYSHVHQLSQYTQHHGQNGLRIFSEIELLNLSQRTVEPGDWLVEMRKQNCYVGKKQSSSFKKSRYAFPLLKFDVEHEDVVYRIAGVHAPNPWKIMSQCMGQFQTGLEMVYGTHNPNYKYAQAIVADFENQGRSIVIGDLNSPKYIRKSIFTAMGNAYKLLQRSLGGSVVKSDQPTAFSSMGNYAIDHAFVSGDLDVSFSEVIQFAGSDHLPVYIVVE